MPEIVTLTADCFFFNVFNEDLFLFPRRTRFIADAKNPPMQSNFIKGLQPFRETLKKIINHVQCILLYTIKNYLQLPILKFILTKSN